MDVTGIVIGIVLVIVTLALIFIGVGKERRNIEETALAADDLVIIEGIGPKIATILKENGVTTFAQLAAANPTRLEQIMRENGMPYVKPGSWPEQARLAAAGQMDELKKLQENLVAGH